MISSKFMAISCALIGSVVAISASAATFMCPKTLTCTSLANCVRMAPSTQAMPFTAAKIVRASTYSAVECEYGRMSVAYSSNGWTDHRQNRIAPARNGHWKTIAEWKYPCPNHHCSANKYLCVSANPENCSVRS